MSMNLCFYTKTSRPRYIEFPFQTPTEWTWEIYNEPNAERRCEILSGKMPNNPWLDGDLVKECIDMLMDPNIELSYI